jgi:hypothetical protein
MTRPWVSKTDRLGADLFGAVSVKTIMRIARPTRFIGRHPAGGDFRESGCAR